MMNEVFERHRSAIEKGLSVAEHEGAPKDVGVVMVWYAIQ